MKRLMRRGAAAGLAIAILAAPLTAGAATAGAATAAETSGALIQVRPVASAPLSPTGQSAIEDLRTCLASDDVLNVYYLIDNSLSLAVEDDGVTPGTDPETMRAEILGNSLQQLGVLGEGRTVNWAAGFFSTDFTPAIGWQSWTASSNAELAETIREKKPGGYTNWRDGLGGAQSALAAQQRAEPGCQVLVWLTDGMMDLRNDADEAPALAALCGTGESDYGLLNTMRQSGTVVLGVLLADEKVRAEAEILRPLVEGAGVVNGAEVSCGQQPIPSTHVRGALIAASDPAALALVFLELATRIAGGYPAPLAADGSFFIDPGVARFQIVVGNDEWMLEAPAASGLGPMTAASPWPGVMVTPSGSATVVEVPIDAAVKQGQWRLDAPDVRDVFLFSDLRIVFDVQNTVELAADGTATSTIGARVQTADGRPADLTVYGTATFHAAMIPADGSALIPLAGANVDPNSGTVSIPLPSNIDTAELLLSASIDPLTTAPHGLQLAPVTTQQRVPTVLPASFPRIASMPVKLDDLLGSDGLAQGIIRVAPAPDGTAAQVCFAADVQMSSDAAARDGSWKWTVGDGTLAANPCIAVPAGADAVEIPITAANDVPADSEVRAALPVTFVSAAGDEIVQQVPISFTSTRPVNAAATGLIALGLLVLGILLPLVILWFVNWFTTTLSIARNTQRGVLPVTVDDAGVHPGGAVDEASLGANVFQNRPPIERERAIQDADLGMLRARVPWWPVKDTWFEVAPPAGTAVVLARTGTRAGSLASRVKQGDRAVRFSNLPLDSFTAIIVSEDELRRTHRGDPVAARVVMYHRPEPGVFDQYTRRLAELGAESDVRKRIDRLRDGLEGSGRPDEKSGRSGSSADGGRAPRGGVDVPQPAAVRPTRAQADAGVPPPPPPRRAGASTIPPRRDGALPPGDGAPPPPPSRGG